MLSLLGHVNKPSLTHPLAGGQACATLVFWAAHQEGGPLGKHSFGSGGRAGEWVRGVTPHVLVSLLALAVNLAAATLLQAGHRRHRPQLAARV